VVTLVLPCFGGGILENGTETQTQEQYSTINNIKDEIIFGTKRAGANGCAHFRSRRVGSSLFEGKAEGVLLAFGYEATTKNSE
jgi:hypothetical protein